MVLNLNNLKTLSTLDKYNNVKLYKKIETLVFSNIDIKIESENDYKPPENNLKTKRKAIKESLLENYAVSNKLSEKEYNLLLKKMFFKNLCSKHLIIENDVIINIII